MTLIIDIIFIILLFVWFIAFLLLNIVRKNLKEEQNLTNLTGFEIAQKISRDIALEEPLIIKKKGRFLDHYNSNRNVIKLTPDVFDGTDIYAAITALNIALSTDKNKTDILKHKDFCSFIIIMSYLLIIIGAFLNNYNIVHFGIILFILSFILEALQDSVYGNDDEEQKVYNYIKKMNIIKPLDEYSDFLVILLLTEIITLPYSFINKFR